MHPSGSYKCLSCGDFFQPHARNRGRQRHCCKVPCQKARKAASQRAWLRKAGNQEYFRGETNVARVQAWRKANPGYWKRRRRAQPRALQDPLIPQSVEVQAKPEQDAAMALQDVLKAQPPVVVGLVAHLTGMTLQDDIAAMMRNLHSRGRAVLGIDVGRPDYAKTPDRHRTGAAHAAPV